MFCSIEDFGCVSHPCEDCSKFLDGYYHCTMNCSGRKLVREAPDLGSVTITRHEGEMISIMVRSPGAGTGSTVTLPFDVWQRIAIPPGLSVSVAGDWTK